MAASRACISSLIEVQHFSPSPIGTRCGSILQPIQTASHEDPNKACFFLIGGANTNETLSDVVSFQLQKDASNFLWERRECVGDYPGRYEAASFIASSHPNEIFVFGGGYEDGTYNDLWRFNTSENSWHEVEQKGAIPSERTVFSAASNGDYLYVWGGGRGQTQPVRDTHVYRLDVNSLLWEITPSKGELLQPRQGHVMVYSEGTLLVHGGMAEESLLDDLFQFNLETSEWSEVKSIGARPEARAAHSAALVPSTTSSHLSGLFIFGGLAIGGALNDLWYFHPKSLIWERLDFLGKPPAPRLDHSMCICANLFPPPPLKDSSSDTTQTHSVHPSSYPMCYSIIVYGGMDTTGTVLKDVFCLKLS